jgi:hypothetical protein
MNNMSNSSNNSNNKSAMEPSTIPSQRQTPGTVPRARVSSKRLRSDLFNKLGIVPESAPASSYSNPRASVLGPIKVVKAPLKGLGDDNEKKAPRSGNNLLDTLGSFFKVGSPSADSITTLATTDDSSSCASSLDGSVSSPQRRRCLTFHEEVSVVTIPRRDQYSNRIQQHLWHAPEQLQTAVQRATIEFAADGWQWEQVRTDQQHIVCPISGQLIHPVHFEIARLIRIEQGLPLDAPVWTPFIKEAPLGVTTAEASVVTEEEVVPQVAT